MRNVDLWPPNIPLQRMGGQTKMSNKSWYLCYFWIVADAVILCEVYALEIQDHGDDKILQM